MDEPLVICDLTLSIYIALLFTSRASGHKVLVDHDGSTNQERLKQTAQVVNPMNILCGQFMFHLLSTPVY